MALEPDHWRNCRRQYKRPERDGDFKAFTATLRIRCPFPSKPVAAWLPAGHHAPHGLEVPQRANAHRLVVSREVAGDGIREPIVSQPAIVQLIHALNPLGRLARALPLLFCRRRIYGNRRNVDARLEERVGHVSTTNPRGDRCNEHQQGDSSEQVKRDPAQLSHGLIVPMSTSSRFTFRHQPAESLCTAKRAAHEKRKSKISASIRLGHSGF